MSVGFYAQFDSFVGWKPRYDQTEVWMASAQHQEVLDFIISHRPSEGRVGEYGGALLAYVAREDAREDVLIGIASLEFRGTEGGGYAYEEARCSAASRLTFTTLLNIFEGLDSEVSAHVLAGLPAEQAEELFRTANPAWTAGIVSLPQVPLDLAKQFAGWLARVRWNTYREVASMWGHRGFPDAVLVEFADPLRSQCPHEDGSGGARLVPPLHMALGHRADPAAPEGGGLEDIRGFIQARWTRLCG